jgi:hypothetical protein
MKKLLVGLIALTSASAFASKSMITLAGFENDRGGDQERTLDLYHSNGGTTHNTERNIALNYAYAIIPAVQLGVDYGNFMQEGADKEESKANRWGLFAIYNFAGQLSDTHYVGLKYTMAKSETDDAADGSADTEVKTKTWTLEGGHRFSLGTLWGMNYNWSPSLQVAISELDPKDGDESSTTEFRLNVLKVDVLF